MKSVCIAGSFKFYKQILELEMELNKEGIPVERPVLDKRYRRGEEPYGLIIPEGITEEELLGDMKKIELDFLSKIDKQQILYIVCPNGYIGKAVAFEIGYAKARGKHVISMCPIEDLPIRALVDDIKSTKELIEYCKSG
ncbi:MAG: hypothetical protein QXX38_02815 [Candidatus Aenigmatarchaeota archaeon]